MMSKRYEMTRQFSASAAKHTQKYPIRDRGQGRPKQRQLRLVEDVVKVLNINNWKRTATNLIA